MTNKVNKGATKQSHKSTTTNTKSSSSKQSAPAPAPAAIKTDAPAGVFLNEQEAALYKELLSQIKVYDRTEALENLLDIQYYLATNEDLDNEVHRPLAGFINYMKEVLTRGFDLIQDQRDRDLLRSFDKFMHKASDLISPITRTQQA